MNLAGKNILLGVTGSIAAYKAADLCSQLGKLEADVHVVLTAHGAGFVGPATFRALTRNPVLTDVFDEPHARRIAHIDLAQSADLVLVAPTTADMIAKMAHGLADDMLATCLLATPPSTPILVAPAMNAVMWDHPATVANLATLSQRGVQIVQPGYGVLACQDVGGGKLADVPEIVKAVLDRLAKTQDFEGVHILITAGATREPLDPVRFLSNRSSGKMGFAVAAEAVARGAKVTVVSGFTTAPIPPGLELIQVESAEEMCAACVERFQNADLFIGAAAVADFTPAEVAAQKIKKTNDTEDLTVRLRRTLDIIGTLGSRKRANQVVVGFAAETQDLLENARKKIESKRLDLIVANDVTAEGAGFDSETNIVTLLWPNGAVRPLALLTKRAVAAELLNAVRPMLQQPV